MLYRWLQGRIARGDAAHSRAVSEASNRVIEFARVQPALRTADENSIADRLVNDALLDQHRSYRGMLATGGAGIATFNAIVQTSLTVVLILGAYLAIGGSVDPVTLIGLLVLAVRFNEPIMNAGGLGGSLAVAQTTLDQFDCLAAIKDLPEPSTPQKPEDWSIRFDDVTFGYGHAPVLEGLSFAAPAGKMTAVVGPSGSGKTTITKLIALTTTRILASCRSAACRCMSSAPRPSRPRSHRRSRTCTSSTTRSWATCGSAIQTLIGTR